MRRRSPRRSAGEGGGAGEGDGEGEGEGGPFAACADVLLADPSAPSGTYSLLIDDSPRTVACDMSADGGGWARLLRYAEGDACPTGWTAAPRGCTRGGSSA